MDPNQSIDHSNILQSIYLSGTPIRKRNRSEKIPAHQLLRQFSTPNQEKANQDSANQEKDVAEKKKSILINNHQCVNCTKDVERKDEYACSTCSIYPLCGPCILGDHLGSCCTFKVVEAFKHRYDLLSSWFKNSGEPNQKIIKSLCTDLEKLLSEANVLIRITPCYDDLILRTIIEWKYIDDVDRSRRIYSNALKMFDDFKQTLTIMNQYANTDSMMPDQFSPIDFYTSNMKEFEELVDKFTQLTQDDNSLKQMRESIGKLENLNRLFRTSTGTVGEQKKKALGRSKSFHGTKK